MNLTEQKENRINETGLQDLVTTDLVGLKNNVGYTVMSSEDNNTNDSFCLDDIYFKDAFTKTGDELNEEIDNLSVKCITSKNGKFSLDSEGNLNVNTIIANNLGSSSGMSKEYVCNLIYPVGSIYMSVNNINPEVVFGGTWQQLKDRFLLGSGDNYLNGNVAGEANHKLTISELPKVSGCFKGSANITRNVPYGSIYLSASGVFNTKTNDSPVCYANSTVVTNNVVDEINMSFGNDIAHNNMPPYLVVNMWKRIA